MKNKTKYTLVFFTLVISIVFSIFAGVKNIVYAEDKSYSITGLDVNANISQSGVMDVTETFHMRFDGGPFTIVYQDIPLVANRKTGNKVTIDNVQVFEGSKKYTQVSEQNGRPYGKYYVGKTTDNIHIEWYHNSEDVDRVFTVKYSVTGAVTSYNDTAELYWQFVGDKWDVPMENVNIKVTIPQGAQKSQIKVFGHGPVQGNVEILDDQSAEWSLDKLPSRSYLEARMLFPVSLVPQNTNNVKENQYKSIMEEEVQAAQKTDREKKLSLIAVAVGILDIIISIAAIIMNYIKYAKKYRIDDVPEYMRELPDDLSPAEVNAFMHYDVPDASGISATVMDLARRGLLGFSHDGKKKVLIHVEDKNTSELTSYEKDLISFLRKVESDGGDLKKYVRKHNQSSKVFFDSFKADVTGNLVSRHGDFYENNISKAMKVPGILIGLNIVMLIIGIFSTPVFIAFSIVAMGILIIAFIFSKRKSMEGAKHEQYWKSFKKFLKNFSNLDKAELPQIAIWEHYLVYAAALGVAKEAIRELNAAYPNMDESYYGGWYNGYFVGYYYGSGIHSMESGFDNMNSLFTDIQKTFTEAYTAFNAASTGGGGGFSGGGGFGGGGGGGGAN